MSTTGGQRDDAAHHQAILRLLHAYGDVCSQRDWPRLRDLALTEARFTWTLLDGSTVTVVGPDAVGAFGARALAQFDFYHYAPGVSAVELHPNGTASGRFHVVETGRTPDGRWQDLYGIYHDEYAFHAGSWQFASRSYELLATR